MDSGGAGPTPTPLDLRDGQFSQDDPMLELLALAVNRKLIPGRCVLELTASQH